MVNKQTITTVVSSAHLCAALRHERLPKINLGTTWWEDREMENPDYHVNSYERTGQQVSRVGTESNDGKYENEEGQNT